MFHHADFFDFFRYVLGTVATVYATVVTLQSLYGWYVWLSGSDKYISMVRRYLVVHGLRLRFMSFWGDVLVSILLSVTFLYLWHAHSLIYQTQDVYEADRQQRTTEIHVRPTAKF